MADFRPSHYAHLFFFACYGAHRDLHSFPTRRSSDLVYLTTSIIAWRTFRESAVRVLYSTRRARDRKSTRLNSSHMSISYAVFCLKKKITDLKGIVDERSPYYPVTGQLNHDMEASRIS